MHSEDADDRVHRPRRALAWRMRVDKYHSIIITTLERGRRIFCSSKFHLCSKSANEFFAAKVKL